MALPHLIVVSGPPGAGKTTLAHRLAVEVGCLALCRDEIKEGMVHATPGFVPGPSDALTMRTYDLFFAAIRLFLDAGVTHVAEAAFQDALWRRGLDSLRSQAELRVVRCQVDDQTARDRAARRLTEVSSRSAHADAAHLAAVQRFIPISMPVPTLDVDTSAGYRPALAAIADFARA